MPNKIKLGFDLGNHSLNIAVLRNGALECQELILPERLMEEDIITMPHAFSAFLKKVRRDLRLPGGPAGLLLPPSQVICRLVTMPRMTVDQLMLNLPYEFNDFIRGEPHQYYCDYAMCRELPRPEGEEGADDPQQMTMMAAAAERRRIQEYVRMFAAGGFSLRRMLPQEMALINLAQACRAARPDGPDEFCFIDLGYLSTRVYVIQGDRVLATRRIPTGCRDLDGVVADLLNVDRFLTDSYKRSNHAGVLDHPRCVEVYEHIAVEALKLINFYHFTYRQNQLSGVYLMGGGAGADRLCRTLTETLGLPALPVEELLPVKASGKAPAASCLCAAGLILGEEG